MQNPRPYPRPTELAPALAQGRQGLPRTRTGLDQGTASKPSTDRGGSSLSGRRSRACPLPPTRPGPGCTSTSGHLQSPNCPKKRENTNSHPTSIRVPEGKHTHGTPELGVTHNGVGAQGGCLGHKHPDLMLFSPSRPSSGQAETRAQNLHCPPTGQRAERKGRSEDLGANGTPWSGAPPQHQREPFPLPQLAVFSFYVMIFSSQVVRKVN